MKSSISGRARRELRRLDKWWRQNRDYKDVFINEFESMIKVLEDKPNIGRPYRTASGKDVLYVLMRKTRHHIFYVIKDDELEIVSVWGAGRGHGPKV